MIEENSYSDQLLLVLGCKHLTLALLRIFLLLEPPSSAFQWLRVGLIFLPWRLLLGADQLQAWSENMPGHLLLSYSYLKTGQFLTKELVKA